MNDVAQMKRRIWDGFLAGSFFGASASLAEQGNMIAGGVAMAGALLLFWLAHRNVTVGQ